MKTEKRISQHAEARHLMDSNSFHQASALILNTIQDHGPHVGLLCDLASSAYLGGQIDLFIRTTRELQNQFQTHQHLLSDKSYMRTCIALGKLLEEIGEVSSALELYQKALLDRPFFQMTQLAFCQEVQVQILRLKSFLGLRSELGEIYQNCAMMSEPDSDLGIEIDHGLMLAESQLLGMEAAQERFRALQIRMEKKTDLRLVYFDLTEELLRQQMAPIDLPFSISELDHFERILFFMSSSRDFSMSLKELQKVQKKMSPLCYLRICILNLSRNNQPEIRRQILLLLEGLGSDSRQVLLKKWSRELSEVKIRTQLQLSAQAVSLQGQSLPLTAGSFELNCLQALMSHRNLSTERMIELGFGIQIDEFAFERLRIAVLRLNKKLSKLTGIPKTLLYSRTQVSLHSEVEIIAAE